MDKEALITAKDICKSSAFLLITGQVLSNWRSSCLSAVLNPFHLPQDLTSPLCVSVCLKDWVNDPWINSGQVAGRCSHGRLGHTPPGSCSLTACFLPSIHTDSHFTSLPFAISFHSSSVLLLRIIFIFCLDSDHWTFSPSSLHGDHSASYLIFLPIFPSHSLSTMGNLKDKTPSIGHRDKPLASAFHLGFYLLKELELMWVRKCLRNDLQSKLVLKGSRKCS